jgi:hypothetical protein
MTYGITRVHGTAQTGASSNLTGTKSSFFSGYQPLLVKVQTVSATWDFTTNAANVDSEFEQLVRAAETVGSVIMYGAPANAASSSTVIIGFDAASLNQGDGVAGSGVTTGLGALKAALASAGGCAASDIAITTYTGFTGAALS